MSTDIDYSIPMDPNREDSAGYLPNYEAMMGARFRHWKTKCVYRVIGFVWDGERDLWLIKHVDTADDGRLKFGEERTEFVRSFENFFELLFPDATVGTEPFARMTRV